MKVFHMADIHLGVSFSYLNHEKAEIRKVESELSFSSQIENAYSKGVRVFLIAGDIFHAKPFDMSSVEFVKRTFEKFSDAEFFVVFGNHDFVTKDEYDYFDKLFSENVHLFFDKMDMYEFDDYRVYGVSFSEEFVKESSLDNFKATNDGKINLMVIHGDIASGSLYNPISISQIENSGVDYIALGHVHAYSGVKKAGRTYYGYCGSHEGKGFDETGEKGGIMLEISDEGIKHEFIPGSKRQHHIIDINAESVTSSSHLIQEIVSAMGDSDDLYKIVIRGETDKELVFDASVLERTIDKYGFYVKVVDETTLKLDMEKLSNEDSLLGGFIREVSDRMNEENADATHWNKVLKKGISLINNR